MAYLNHEIHDCWVRVPLSGNLTCELTQKIRGEAEAFLAGLGEQPVLACDLSAVRFLDSSGIGFLVFLNNKIRQKGGRLFLMQPSAEVRKTLDLVQLLSFFDLVDNEVELLAQIPA